MQWEYPIGNFPDNRLRTFTSSRLTTPTTTMCTVGAIGAITTGKQPQSALEIIQRSQ